jgi:hypothetical protein
MLVPFVPANSPDAVGPAFEGSGEGGGYTPSEIRAAYRIPGTGGSGQTVAVVDPYNDPDVESNLKTYRERYGLPECTKTSGCFKEVNQNGEAAPLPKEEKEGWGFEMSLDLDMVSAACPECKLLLVEAENNGWANLGKAENEAAKLANTIDDSWYGKEVESYATEYGSYFKHEGVPIAAASGDVGYGVGFPAGSPSVIAVGGTALKKEPKSERGWVEEVWRNTAYKLGEDGAGTGSGCALKGEKKPEWQHDKGCANRTDNDVAMVAAASTPVSMYDSFGYKGWVNANGTSVGTPLVAGVEGLAEKSVKELGAKVFYEKPGHQFEVTKGSNGTCTPPAEDEYLCTAGKGYNGPAGMGALDGVPTLGPAATTGAATGVTEKEATVHGKVNPEGLETKYYFEYGTSEKYGEKTAEASAGSGMSVVEVSKALTGLTANTKYYYRIVATNSKGTADVGGEIVCTHWCVKEPASPKEETELWGVSCASSTACVAVGADEAVGGSAKPLAERWNGIEWSLETLPVPPTAKFTQLHGVSCTSSTACVAVGYWGNSEEKFVPLAEKWNGTEWTLQEPPDPKGASFGDLAGVSCAVAAECIAVGAYEADIEGHTRSLPLAEKWNGTEWSAQEPSDPKEALAGSLGGVSCTSSSACMAAGSYETSSTGPLPMAEKWNGTEWSAEALPDPKEAVEGQVGGVSCTASSACIAAGDWRTSALEEYAPLAEKWNGTEWSLQTPPDPTGAKWGTLSGVSCVSSTECIADGVFENSSGKPVPLAERLNGSEWASQQPPTPTGTKVAALLGVSCLSVTECYAGGYFENGSALLSLAELYE